jgi:hypothetical protein
VHRLNLTGRRYGRLTVLRDSGRSDKKQQALHLVKCDCGKKLLVDSTHLTSGEALSCGCTRNEHLGTVRPLLRGEDQPTHKLTEDDVRSIRLMYATGDWLQRELATDFNVWQSCISKVLLGKTWRHVTT